jgi:hypothetical protein
VGADVDALLDEVARRAGLRAHDCPLAPHDPVEERALSRVGLADDDRRDSLAQQRSRALGGEKLLRPPEDRGDLALQAAAVLGGKILVGEIDVGLDC